MANRSLFLFAMQRAESIGSARIVSFNAMFAYHRALLVLCLAGVLLLIWAIVSGETPQLSFWRGIGLVAAALLATTLIWYRAWQRACYYAREVLLTARALLDQDSLKTAPPSSSS